MKLDARAIHYSINHYLNDLDLLSGYATAVVSVARSIEHMTTELALRLVEVSPNLDCEDETLP